MTLTNSRHLLLRVLITIAVAIVLWWAWHRSRTITIDSGYRQVMGTFANIVVVDDDGARARQAIEAAFEKIHDIDARMSDYDPNSLLSKVNRRAFEESVQVDGEVFEVLAAAVEFSNLSDGAFDITVGPIVQLWRNARQEGTAPDPAALEQARACVGYQNLGLNPKSLTVRFAKEGMALDLGGIAKGYAIDRAVDILKELSIQGAMVNIGGDLRCFGTPPDGVDHWLIGLQDPQQDENILLALKLDDRAVATSGDYRRFVVIDGERYSHIVNPATAGSAQTLSSVSIIAHSAMQADALATAVSVLGDQKGMQLIESIPETEAVLIPHGPSLEMETTTAAEQYIQQ